MLPLYQGYPGYQGYQGRNNICSGTFNCMKEVSMEYIAHVNFDNKIQSCNEHSVNTAKTAAKRVDSIGLYHAAYLAGILHDAGKYSDEFCQYIIKAVNGEGVSKGSVIHSFAGCSYLLSRFHNDELGYSDVASEIIAYAIGAHHGLFDLANEEGTYGFEHRINKQPEYDKFAMQHFLESCVSKDEIAGLFNKAVTEISGKIDAILELSNGNDEETLFY